MPIWDAAISAVNPYLLYIKLAAIALILLLITGIAWYIRSTFQERDQLLADKAKLEFSLVTEQQRVAVAMEQLKIWQDTVAKMNAAIRGIKIESNNYIERVENAKPPAHPNGTVIPFVLSGVSASSTMPKLEVASSSRKRSATP